MSTDSARLKAIGLAYLRFGRQMPIACTEAGRWKADILGINAVECIEIEVKVSKSDLKAEFKKKTAKHFLYNNSSSNMTCPSYFYFLVPEHLQECALELLKEHSPKTGLLVCECDTKEYTKDCIKVVKKATRITQERPSRALIATAMSRCSSELCGLYAKNNRLAAIIAETVEQLRDDLTSTVSRTFGTLDFEDPVKDIENRAKEMAFCVDGISETEWENMPRQAKKKWIEASARWLKLQTGSAEEIQDETFFL